MADLPHRLQYESDMAKEIARILARHQREWEQYNTTSPETERSLKDKLLAFLALIFGLGATTAAGELGIALVSQGSAAAWANSYSGYLSRRIVDGIQKRLQRAANRDLTRTTTIVADTVQAIQTPQNWANLAATEITRANTAGGEFAASVYNITKGVRVPSAGPIIPGTPLTITPPNLGDVQADLPPATDADNEFPPGGPQPPPEVAQAYWYTSKDDRVCPVCRPLDGMPRDVWQTQFPLGPPAHGMCRCWIDYQVGAREHIEPIPTVGMEHCGANAPGGGGFQPGNTCGKGSTLTIKKHGKAVKPEAAALLEKYKAEAESKGVSVSASIEIETKLANRAGQFIYDDNRITINQHYLKQYSSSGLKSAEIPGWSSVSRYDFPASTVIHECGHAAHADALKQSFGVEKARQLFVSWAKRPVGGLATVNGLKVGSAGFKKVAKQVSDYAASNPLEFVAEVYTGRKYGKEYPNVVNALYEALGGPD